MSFRAPEIECQTFEFLKELSLFFDHPDDEFSLLVVQPPIFKLIDHQPFNLENILLQTFSLPRVMCTLRCVLGCTLQVKKYRLKFSEYTNSFSSLVTFLLVYIA